jgi:hypothetical protein
MRVHLRLSFSENIDSDGSKERNEETKGQKRKTLEAIFFAKYYKAFKCWRMRWVRHIASMVIMKNAYCNVYE